MTDLINQPSAAVNRKVTWATLGAMAASVAPDIIVGLLPSDMPVDPDQLEWLFVGVVTLAAGYFMRERG